MSPNVKLIDFPVFGRGELVRLTLKAGGIDYEEEFVPFSKWPSRKPHTPWGTLPVLYWDDEEIGQAFPIARFVARKAGLAGKDDIEMARADVMADQVADLIIKYIEIRFCADPQKKKELVDAFKDVVFPQFLRTAERRLRLMGGKYFTGSELSYGDIAVFFMLDLMANSKVIEASGLTDVHPVLLKSMGGCTNLTRLHKTVKSHPKIAAYLRIRPAYDG